LVILWKKTQKVITQLGYAVKRLRLIGWQTGCFSRAKVGVLEKWFGVPQVFALLPVPLMCALAFFGLAYRIFPDIVIGRMTVWEAAISTASLNVIFVGVAITLPVIIAYTVFMYRVFWGKATALKYG
jgi:cytochrome bd-type quinol oxidase subunit 2